MIAGRNRPYFRSSFWSPAARAAVTACLDAKHAHIGVLEEIEEKADGIAAATDTGDEFVGQTHLLGQGRG